MIELPPSPAERSPAPLKHRHDALSVAMWKTPMRGLWKNGHYSAPSVLPWYMPAGAPCRMSVRETVQVLSRLGSRIPFSLLRLLCSMEHTGPRPAATPVHRHHGDDRGELAPCGGQTGAMSQTCLNISNAPGRYGGSTWRPRMP